MALCYEQHKHTHDLHLCPKPGAACGSVRSSRCLRRLVHIPPVALCYEQHKHTHDLHLCPKPGAACGSVRSSQCLGRLVEIPPVALCYEQHKPLTNLHIVAGLRAPMAPHYEGQEPSLGWPTGLHGMTPKLWRQRMWGVVTLF